MIIGKLLYNFVIETITVICIIIIVANDSNDSRLLYKVW